MAMKVEVVSKAIPRVTAEMLPCMAVPVTQSLAAEQQVFLITTLKNPVTTKSEVAASTLSFAVTHLQGEGGTEIVNATELAKYTPVDPDLSVSLKN